MDGVEKQNGSTGDMIFSIPSIISHVSKIMTLEKGDLILTGTPSGVGPVSSGNTLIGKLFDEHGKLMSSIAFPVIDRVEPVDVE